MDCWRNMCVDIKSGLIRFLVDGKLQIIVIILIHKLELPGNSQGLDNFINYFSRGTKYFLRSENCTNSSLKTLPAVTKTQKREEKRAKCGNFEDHWEV